MSEKYLTSIYMLHLHVFEVVVDAMMEPSSSCTGKVTIFKVVVNFHYRFTKKDCARIKLF